ncbi:hypothetical protein [Paraburkholderia terricola]|uniref:hypothetical protein n=1 Tax=Paraburkholderia terricola TaxID=169427 RepID=UPI00285AB785|nr:hypothetical protein [Paraburkholderia terricola]MDR6485356.1 hypothetical protein [Paraburkholderia terricola]
MDPTGNPTSLDDLLEAVETLMYSSISGRMTPAINCANVQEVISQARTVVSPDLTALCGSLCAAESLCVLKRPAEALSVLHAALLRHTTSPDSEPPNDA